MSRCVLACWIGLAAVAPCLGKVDDGVYPVTQGEGTPVKLSGGGDVKLGARRGYTWEKATLRSLANDNSRFVVALHNIGNYDEKDTPATVVLLIDDVCMPFSSRTQVTDGPLILMFAVQGEESARKVANKLGVEPVLRQHPGHRVVLDLKPAKESYVAGEPVTVNVGIRNAGNVPILFQKGGKQRGPRDNQYRFMAYAGHGWGKAVPDTGDPANFGGLSSMRMLKPGETVEDQIQLDKWFQFAAPDTYRVTGLFEMELSEMPDRGLRQVIWDELIVGECSIKIEAKRP